MSEQSCRNPTCSCLLGSSEPAGHRAVSEKRERPLLVVSQCCASPAADAGIEELVETVNLLGSKVSS